MTQKHTSGPWEFTHEFGKHYALLREGRWFGRVRGAENARLIAAAPELLEELSWIRQFIHKQEGGVGINMRNLDGKECRKWLDRVDAAITKATNTL